MGTAARLLLAIAVAAAVAYIAHQAYGCGMVGAGAARHVDGAAASSGAVEDEDQAPPADPEPIGPPDAAPAVAPAPIALPDFDEQQLAINAAHNRLVAGSHPFTPYRSAARHREHGAHGTGQQGPTFSSIATEYARKRWADSARRDKYLVEPASV